MNRKGKMDNRTNEEKEEEEKNSPETAREEKDNDEKKHGPSLMSKGQVPTGEPDDMF